MRVSALHIYPLKSARGLWLPDVAIGPKGLEGDRLAMLVLPDGTFLTQREEPGLARISALWSGDGLVLTHGDASLVARPTSQRTEIDIWDEKASAALAEPEISDAVSTWLGREIRLVFADAGMNRLTDTEWTQSQTPLGFSDGFQILVVTTGSLTALNAQLVKDGHPTIGMDRFRPNIVIDHDEPFAEDHWSAIEIGGIRFDLVKPCPRCIMTTQDQKTGDRTIADPMPALRALRMSMDSRVKGVLFGWNVVPTGTGRLSVGDAVRVMESRPEGWRFRQAKAD